MRRFIPFLILAGLALAGWAGPAHAGFMYQLADAAGTSAATFTLAAAGDRLAVRVYLVESGGSELAINGLFSAGVALTYDSPAGVAAVAGVGDVVPNADFVNLVPAPSVTPTSAGLTGDVDLNPFILPDPDGRILLGEFTLTALAPGTLTLRATDRNLLTDDTLSGSFTVLDGDIAGAFAELRVLGGPSVAVPEPSSLLLAVGGATALSLAFRRVQRRGGGGSNCRHPTRGG